MVKYFLKAPEKGEPLLAQLLEAATEKAINPDLRDRAYIYWRMLSSDPEKAKIVIFSTKPPWNLESQFFD